MRDEIVSIQELESILRESGSEIVKAFMETRPDMLCRGEFIARKHFDVIMEEIERHESRVVFSEEIDSGAIGVQGFAEQVKGVYFLLDEDMRVVYVGQGVNVYDRVVCHLKDKLFYFVYVKRIESREEMYLVEDANIKYYNPGFNQNIPFSGYSLLKKFLLGNDYEGVEVSEPVFSSRRVRRSYAKIRRDRVKKKKEPEEVSFASRSIINPEKWAKYKEEMANKKR